MFEYKGETYSLAELQKAAFDQGFNFEDYLQMYKDDGMIEIGDTQKEIQRREVEDPFFSFLGVDYREDGTVIKEKDYNSNPNIRQKAETFGQIIDANISEASAPLQAVVGTYKALFGDPSQELDIEETDKYKDYIVKDFLHGIGQAAKIDWNRSKGVQAGLDIGNAISQGRTPSRDDLKELYENDLKIAAMGQTDEQRAYAKVYEANKEKYGGVTAWFMAVGENPTFLTQSTAGSMANQIGSFIHSPETMAKAITGGLTAAAANKVMRNPLGYATSFLSGLYGTISGSMEQSYTFVELMKEQLAAEGKDFTPENMQELLSNDEIVTFKDPRFAFMDITGTRREIFWKRATRRGIAIGFTDFATGALVGKGSTFAAPIAGGLTSEVLGQTAGGQEYDAGEILTEGFAEKAGPMVGVGVTRDLYNKIKNPAKYSINGHVMKKKLFDKVISRMDDLDIAMADIKVENDNETKSKLYKRQKQAIDESQVDARIKDPAKRKEIVRLGRELEKAEADAKKTGWRTVPGAKKRVEVLKAKIETFAEEAAKVDARTKDVKAIAKIKEMVGQARDKIKLQETEAFLKKGVEQLDLNPYQSFKTTKDFTKGIVDYLMKQKQYTFDGVKVDITKMSDEQIAEETQRIIDSASKGAGAVNLGNTIYINREAAIKYNQLDVGSHEILHSVLRGALATMDIKARKKMIAEFKQEISNNLGTKVLEAIDKRLREAYTDKEGKLTIDLETTDEWFTALSDVIQSKKNNITYDNSKSFFDNMKDMIPNIFKKQTDYKNLSITTGKQAFEFMKEYSKNVKKGKLSERMVAFAKGKKIPSKKKEVEAAFSKKQTDAINELGRMGWTNKSWKEQGADFAIKEMKENKMLDALIRSKYKADVVPENFVDLVYAELVNHVRNFKPEQNDNLFGWVNSQIANKANNVYNREFKKTKQEKTAKDIDDRTKEGEVKVQIAAEEDIAMKRLEEEDLSLAGIAKKERAEAKRKETVYSKLRKVLGIETGSELYNRILEGSRKSLIRAYETGKPVRQIQRDLKNAANTYIFKAVKNMLGVGKNYIPNIKKLRESIVESMFTADLVQMEREVPDGEKVFTRFVKTLTNIEEVQAAVDQNLLPPSAINTIKRGQSVSLYEKVMPTENEFVAFFDQPAINPETGKRSGLKGTRKDQLAKYLANSLSLDAMLQVAQESEVIKKRLDFAELRNETIAEDDLQVLSATIGRDINVKFSKSNAIRDIDNAIDIGVNTNVYLEIKFSKSHRDQYEKRLAKKRTDLSEEQVKNAVQSIFDFVNGKDIPNNKKSKYEKLAMHYMVNGFLILPEDGYKVIEAERVAAIKKIDPFSYKNPNVLIEENVVRKKVKRTNPDKVKTFTNKTEYANGVVVYDVEDSKDGQLDVRKVIDTHFGEKANPWCLCARTGEYIESDEAYSEQEAMKKKQEHESLGRDVLVNTYEATTDDASMNIKKGDTIWELVITDKTTGRQQLDNAFVHWQSYNEEGNGFKIAFQNGKLIAFRDGNNMEWWDRMDKPSDTIIVKGKKTKDGFVEIIKVYKDRTELAYYEKRTGDKKNYTYIRKDINGVVTLKQTMKNGRKEGEEITVESRAVGNAPGNDFVSTVTSIYKDGVRLSFKEVRVYKNKNAKESISFGENEIQFDNITKYERVILTPDGIMEESQSETITIEGTINQKYFIESQNPNEIKDAWVKGQLEYLTAAHERYYSRQGEKVTVTHTRIGNRTETLPTVLINNVKQDVITIVDNIAKFSKNNKFSFTELQQNRKTLPGILKKQFEVEKRILKEPIEGDLILLEKLSDFEKAIESGVNPLTAYDLFMQSLPESTVSLLTDFSNVDNFVEYIKNILIPEIRQLGFKASKVYLKNKTKGKKNKTSIINSFLKNIGRSVRSAMLGDITTNRMFIEGPLTSLFGKEFVKENYRLVPTEDKKGEKVQYKEGNKWKDVPMYENIENIKNNARSNIEIINTVNKEAAEARQYIQDIIDSDLSISEILAIIDLMSIGQRGAIRKMYTFGETVNKESNLSAKDLVLEHEITVKNMTKYLRQRVKGIITQNQLEQILDQAKVHVLPKKINDIFSKEKLTQDGGRKRYQNQAVKNYLKNLRSKNIITGIPVEIKEISNLNSAVKFSRSTNKPTKGITILDFDDTLATSKSLIRFTRPDGTKGTLTPEQYANTYEDLLGLGYEFDFSEFNEVIDGKPAPLLDKAKKLASKFGTDNMFILTARPAESAVAIQRFLKENGLNIPLENITGLGNSTSEAKALWVLEKAAEGYNDFYFADDAIQNVQAVQNMLDQIDVKSKVQQAKVKFSKSINKQFNDILENVTGIESKKRFSAVKARKRGEKKGRFRFFIPPSHEDFVGILYNFIGKGKEGNKHRDFFEKVLIRPLNRAYRELNTARQSIANDYKSLNKRFPNIKKKLAKKIPDGDFTFEDAIRVYLWNKHGYSVPGLSKTDQTNLSELVMADQQLQLYAENLNIISKQKKYIKPLESWESGDIRTDLDDATGRIGRAEFFTEFFENVDIVFSEENLNKIEAAYGIGVVDAIKDILYRTKTGRNRPSGQNKLVNEFLNYLNGSVASTMFFNTRSAVLQQMSMVNFINFADNNIFAAAKAFANQKQYWSDWATIFNSDFMKQRRGGIKTDVNGAELAQEVKGSKHPIRTLIAKLLELGFLPTQIGDNIAIATGGATYYRNRINTYLTQTNKETGKKHTQQEAEAKAWTDFAVLAEATQQSARPDMVSQQQASPLGKVILAFQNVTSQFNRLGKKAFLDFKNRRISPEYKNTSNPQLQSDMSNLSRMAYYFAIQNLVFYSLQSALFMALFDDDEDDEKWLSKKERVINGSIDSVLRGTGVWGAVAATLKNMAIKWHEQRDKGYNKDESAVLMEMLNVSPPLGIKARKVVNAEKTLNYNKKLIEEMETFDIDNPTWSAYTSYFEALTNIPANRMYNKTQNIRGSLDNQHNALERALMFSGYSKWNLGIPAREIEKVKKKQGFGVRKGFKKKGFKKR